MECHGPTQQMRGLRLDRRVSALPNRIGANGARIIPGNSEASVLYQRISGTTAGPRMPPSGPLSAEQIALVKSWIDEGAEWHDALSGEQSATTSDPVAERIGTALRNGRQEDFRRILRGNPQSLNAKGRGGWTPLMYAAVYGHTEDLRLLLERGAGPNSQNDDGATALMYAVDDPIKVRLLPRERSGSERSLRPRPHRVVDCRRSDRDRRNRDAPSRQGSRWKGSTHRGRSRCGDSCGTWRQCSRRPLACGSECRQQALHASRAGLSPLC